MKHQIIYLGEKNQKTLGISDEDIIISSKSHRDFSSLAAAKNKSGLLETVTIIPLKALESVEFNEKDNNFIIRYRKGGKSKKFSVVPEDVDIRERLVTFIGSLRDMEKSEAEESKTQPLLLNIAGLLFILGLTYVFRGMAVDAENGVEYVATGRRSGLKNLLADLVESLGPTWVTVIGVLAALVLAYVAYNRYQHPAREVKYRATAEA